MYELRIPSRVLRSLREHTTWPGALTALRAATEREDDRGATILTFTSKTAGQKAINAVVRAWRHLRRDAYAIHATTGRTAVREPWTIRGGAIDAFTLKRDGNGVAGVTLRSAP